MNSLKLILLTATFMLAMTFTLSCSSSDDDDNGPSGGKGNNMANYRTEKIGTQTWMAENLDYAVEGSKCYNNVSANCAKYGRLYDWATAMTVCPSGWHLPSDADWNILMNYVQTDNGSTYTSGSEASIAGEYLKATSGWKDMSYEDKYGFTALPGGVGEPSGYFRSAVDEGTWWSSSEYDSSRAYGRSMYYSGEHVSWTRGTKNFLLSVRCIQD